MADGAQLGATSCGVEVAATSAPAQRKGKYLGAKIHGADLLGTEMQFVFLKIYLLESFARRVKKQKMQNWVIPYRCMLYQEYEIFPRNEWFRYASK